MPPSQYISRAQQPATSIGLGVQFTSPVKVRDKKKTTTIVIPPGHFQKKRRLLEKLEALKCPISVSKLEPAPDHDAVPFCALEDAPDIYTDNPAVSDSQKTNDPPTVKAKNRILPDAQSNRLYQAWIELLPTLVDPLLQYRTQSVGSPLKPTKLDRHNCSCSYVTQSLEILCLFYDRMPVLFACELLIYSCYLPQISSQRKWKVVTVNQSRKFFFRMAYSPPRLPNHVLLFLSTSLTFIKPSSNDLAILFKPWPPRYPPFTREEGSQC